MILWNKPFEIIKTKLSCKTHFYLNKNPLQVDIMGTVHKLGRNLTDLLVI